MSQKLASFFPIKADYAPPCWACLFKIFKLVFHIVKSFAREFIFQLFEQKGQITFFCQKEGWGELFIRLFSLIKTN